MNFKLDIDKNKIEAIKLYLPKETSADDELNRIISEAVNNSVDKLYKRYVPKQVRDFCERAAETKIADKKIISDSQAGEERE